MSAYGKALHSPTPTPVLKAHQGVSQNAATFHCQGQRPLLHWACCLPCLHSVPASRHWRRPRWLVGLRLHENYRRCNQRSGLRAPGQ